MNQIHISVQHHHSSGEMRKSVEVVIGGNFGGSLWYRHHSSRRKRIEKDRNVVSFVIYDVEKKVYQSTDSHVQRQESKRARASLAAVVILFSRKMGIIFGDVGSGTLRYVPWWQHKSWWFPNRYQSHPLHHWISIFFQQRHWRQKLQKMNFWRLQRLLAMCVLLSSEGGWNWRQKAWFSWVRKMWMHRREDFHHLRWRNRSITGDAPTMEANRKSCESRYRIQQTLL